MQLIEKTIDIDILYRALSLLKFGSDEDARVELLISPYFNRMFSLLAEDVKARFSKGISKENDFWDISNRKELSIVIKYLEAIERWHEFTSEEKRVVIINIVSPFTITEEFCSRLIKQMDDHHNT